MFTKGNIPLRRTCKHLIVHDTLNNNATISPATLDPNALLRTISHHCNAIALSNQNYCRFHIELYVPDYYNTTQRNATQRNNDIRTLSILLTRLINKDKAYEDSTALRIIALLRKCIDKLTEQNKAQRNALTQDKADIYTQRIADVITAYAPDKRTEIGLKLKDIAKEYISKDG